MCELRVYMRTYVHVEGEKPGTGALASLSGPPPDVGEAIWIILEHRPCKLPTVDVRGVVVRRKWCYHARGCNDVTAECTVYITVLHTKDHAEEQDA